MEGRPKPICPLNFFQVGGIKTFCGEISQYSKKCSPYFLTVGVVQCTVCFSTSITVIKRRRYSHCLKDVLTMGTLFSFETVENGYEFYPLAEH